MSRSADVAPSRNPSRPRGISRSRRTLRGTVLRCLIRDMKLAWRALMNVVITATAAVLCSACGSNEASPKAKAIGALPQSLHLPRKADR